MRIKTNSGNFEPCPEYTGRAVCVDVTPLKTVQTQYGPKEKFRFVFEIEKQREDGSAYCVWSQPFTPSYHENAALRPFLRKWMGREMTPEELKTFDTEDMLHRPAHITVIHEHSDGEVYANIALIQPDKSGEPLQPCGKYVRQKDRPPKDGQAGPTANGAGAQSGYRRAEQPASATPDHASVKVHVGKYAGHELRDLSEDALRALAEKWLPIGKANPKPTADDRRLMAALDWWLSTQEKANDDLAF
jgi:hypothetical protein